MRLCLIGNPNIAHIRRWVQDFFNLGWEVHLIGDHPLNTTPPDNCIFYDLPRQFNTRKLRYLAWGFIVRSLMKHIRPHLVHSLGVTSAGWLGAATGFKPFLVSALGSDLMLLGKRNVIHRVLSRWTLHQADHVLCVSTPLYQKAGVYGVPAEKRQVVYMGVDTKIFTFAEDRNQKRKMLGLPNSPIILSLRAVRPVYHPHDLARAIPGVVECVPEAKFVIFTYNADPNVLAEFRRILETTGVSQSVYYIPELADDHAIVAYYQVADIAVSIPESDGMPTSVLEAMACGCSLVASDLPNLHEWVRHEEEGLLTPVGDIASLTASIVRLLRDPPLREKIQAQAARKIQQLGNRESMLIQVLDIYARFTRIDKPSP